MLATKVAAFFLLMMLGSALVAQQTKALKNQDVVAMVKAGLDEPTIVMAIQTNQENFDLTVPGLIELKGANVSDAVIRAMADKRAKKRVTNASETKAAKESTASIPAPALSRRGGPAVFRAFPIDFSAESFAKIGANAPTVSEGKVFVGGGKLRFETSKDRSTTIVDPLKPAAYVVSPGKEPEVKTVFQGVRGAPAAIPGLSRFLLPVDPQDPCENWDTVECKAMGTEVIDGRTTTKWDLTHRFENETWDSFIWVDVRLHVVSKRQFMENIFQLQNISEGSQPSDLFKVP